VPCLFLEEGELVEDKEFYCPNCTPEKEEEFSTIRERLQQLVEELSGRQTEFGGVTIDRDMFKEKKNANPYNYAKDFPPTLRDLGIRVKNAHKTIGDFKWDYKLMCSRLGEELKDDFESRIQMVEWELDEIVEEILKEEEVVEEEPDHIEVDLDMVKREKMEPADVQECGAICEYCALKFSSTSIYSCKREHRVCNACRTNNAGCVCPVCYSKYGDRKRLALDHTSALLFRVANATNFDVAKMGKRKRKPGPKSRTMKNIDPMDPMIMNVWSCTDENTSTMNMDHVDIEGPIVKAEPEYDYEEPEQVSMSTVLTENCLSNQLLTLIDHNIVATNDPDIAEVNQSPHTSPLSQQPTNYNDTGDPLSYSRVLQPKLEPVEHDEQLEGLDHVEVENFALSDQEISDHINSIREPVEVSSVETRIMGKREDIQRLTLAKKRGENVGNMIQLKREEIIQLRQEEEQRLLQGGIEVLDPFQAMDYHQEGENQTAINLGEAQESPWRKQASSSSEATAKVLPSSIASSWAKYRARAETINKLPVKRFQTETGKKVHTLQVAADGSMQIAPVQPGGSVQPHPLPSPGTVSYNTIATNTVQYTSVGTVTMKQSNKMTPDMLAQQRDNVVEYQPSDTDQYQVESTVQFPPSLEVNHQPKVTGTAVHYQKVGDNVYRKVSPSKGQSTHSASSQPASVVHTGPSKPPQTKQPLPQTPCIHTGPSKPTQPKLVPTQAPHIHTGPSKPVQPRKPPPQAPPPQPQYITPEPIYEEYYNPAEQEQYYNPADQQQYYNPAGQQEYYNLADEQYYNPADSQRAQYQDQQQYQDHGHVQQQYQAAGPSHNVHYVSQSQHYNQVEAQQVEYQTVTQVQPVQIHYSKPSPAVRQKVSPIKSPKTRTIKVSPVKSQVVTTLQHQIKSQPTYTIQYTKPNPFSDPLLISPHKKLTSSTALSSPAPVQKPRQVIIQRPNRTQKQATPVHLQAQNPMQVRQPTPTQYNPVTIKYNQPNPAVFQPQPITGSTTKQMPQPQPLTGPTTKQFLTSSADSSSTPLAITIKYNQPGPPAPGMVMPKIVTRSLLISPPKHPPVKPLISIDEQCRKDLEARGCTCESLTPRAREHVFTGPLKFSLLQNYQGTDLEWKPFLALYAATGPEMYQFQLGRAGNIFYIRGVTSLRANIADRWKVQLTTGDPLHEPLEVYGVFSVLGEGAGQPPSVLPSDINTEDVKHYILTVSQ